MSSAVNAPRFKRVTMSPRLESRSCFLIIGSGVPYAIFWHSNTRSGSLSGGTAAVARLSTTAQTEPGDPRRTAGDLISRHASRFHQAQAACNLLRKQIEACLSCLTQRGDKWRTSPGRSASRAGVPLDRSKGRFTGTQVRACRLPSSAPDSYTHGRARPCSWSTRAGSAETATSWRGITFAKHGSSRRYVLRSTAIHRGRARRLFSSHTPSRSRTSILS